MNKAIAMLLKDKSDTELLEVMCVAMTDDDNALLDRIRTSLNNTRNDANVAVVSTIVLHVVDRIKGEASNEDSA